MTDYPTDPWGGEYVQSGPESGEPNILEIADAEHRIGEASPELHNCATCPDCLHDGRRCCGCYDGACCKRADVRAAVERVSRFLNERARPMPFAPRGFFPIDVLATITRTGDRLLASDLRALTAAVVRAEAMANDAPTTVDEEETR